VSVALDGPPNKGMEPGRGSLRLVPGVRLETTRFRRLPNGFRGRE
jgi:hypothetical protein